MLFVLILVGHLEGAHCDCKGARKKKRRRRNLHITEQRLTVALASSCILPFDYRVSIAMQLACTVDLSAAVDLA